MALVCAIPFDDGFCSFRVRTAFFLTLFLSAFLFSGISYTLTLERPSVDVNWDRLPARRTAQPNVQYAPNRLFGTVEFRSAIKNVPQWERVMRLYKNKNSIDEDFVKAGRKAETQMWDKIKAEAKSATPLQTLQAVNKFFNLWPYRTDMEVYGLVDYWATPAEFISKSGDCDDYAITKMFALIQLGFKPENMRIVALKDRIRNIDHAVLAVYLDQEVYILDNVSPLVLSHSKYGHYQPVLSVNMGYKWAHVPPSR
ncbi:MAG: transglutaminase-like cysteine peptidase [Deltaproteobacteria bacterium]|jgi:predicted transglutaminase-like cysteine proteinase|nr:transglutaminase-like cysteine peptidase [Deltaproteobacteria bacterium]